MRRSLSLQTQLVVAMVVSVVATVGIALSTTTVLMNAQDAEFRAALSAGAVAAQAEIAQGREPADDNVLRELLTARQRVYGDASVLDGTVLGGIAAASILVGGLLGVGLARRLGRPLGEVSAAARRVAAGDLKARAARTGALAGETLRLVDNFNAMAEALEGFQRRAVEAQAAIAHELRTPLAILRGRLEGMREGLFPSDPAAIGRLISHVEALGRIVDDLQVVSLAEAGQLRVTRRDVDLAAEVGVLLDTAEPELAAQGLALERSLAPVQAWADPDRLRQATLALLDNARQHASEGRVVRVETGIDGGMAAVRVLDRGPGLPAVAAARLFEPFWRADASRSRESGGSGLGLSVVAAIARAHGGTARAEARAGGGTTFSVLIPTARPALDGTCAHPPRTLHEAP